MTEGAAQDAFREDHAAASPTPASWLALQQKCEDHDA
jgi:hypothetical protein